MALEGLAPGFEELAIPVRILLASAPPGTPNPYAFAAAYLLEKAQAPFPTSGWFKRLLIFFALLYLVCIILIIAGLFGRWQRGKLFLLKRQNRVQGTYFKPNPSCLYLFPCLVFVICIFVSLVNYILILYKERPASDLVPWRTLPWSAIALCGIWHGYTYLYTSMFCDDLTNVFIPFERPPAVPHAPAWLMNGVIIFSPVAILTGPIVVLILCLIERSKTADSMKELIMGLGAAAKAAAVASATSGLPITVDPELVARLQIIADQYHLSYRRVLGCIRLMYSFYALYSITTLVLFIVIGFIVNRELSMQINILLDLVTREESIRMTATPDKFTWRYIPYLWNRFQTAFDPNHRKSLKAKRQALPKDIQTTVNYIRNSRLQFRLICINTFPCAGVFTATSLWGVIVPYLRPDQAHLDEIRTVLSFGNYIFWGTMAIATMAIFGFKGEPIPTRTCRPFKEEKGQHATGIDTTFGQATTEVGTRPESKFFVGFKDAIRSTYQTNTIYEEDKGYEATDDGRSLPRSPLTPMD